MKPISRLSLLAFLCLCCLGSCKKRISKSDVEASLKTAMTHYLNTQPSIDSNKIKFIVKEVSFYEEKDMYACEFKVELKTPHSDTTGMMVADVTKNFERVIRKN